MTSRELLRVKRQLRKNLLFNLEDPELRMLRLLKLEMWFRRTIRVSTTRLEALYGTTFVALSPTHPLALDLCDATVLAGLAEQREQVRHRYEKKGIALDLTVRHPFTGQLLPVYIVNYVQGEYGCGAVAGVPGHDTRDAEFAELKNLPSVWVTRGQQLASDTQRPVLDSSGTVVKSGPFSGLTINAARERDGKGAA